MKKLIISALLLSNFSSYSMDVNSCFDRVTKDFHAVPNTAQENFQKYMDDLRACQEQGLDTFQEEEYLGKDYNDCMSRADKKHDRDSTRCDKKTNASERTRCQSQSDKRHESSKSSCERVQHSDNAAKIWGK